MKFSKLVYWSTLTLLSVTVGAYASTDVKKPLIRDTLLNPGLDAQEHVVSYLKDTQHKKYTIDSLPKHATLYYDGVKIEHPNFTLSDPNKLTIDPDDGNITVLFSYTSEDQEGKVNKSRNVIMRFVDLVISGSAFHDYDGNGIVDGKRISEIEGKPLYVTLINRKNEILASKPLSSEGRYHFDNSDGVQPNTNYAIVISTQKDTFSSVMPENWSYSGESINSQKKGKDAHKDGVIVVKIRDKNIADVDFGLDIRPTAVDKKSATQLNPGSNIQVRVPTLEGKDKENGPKVRYLIASLPKNATLYDNGKKLTKAGVLIKDVSKITVDPDDGDQEVLFDYVTADNVAVLSHPATVTMPFVGLTISGTVYDDGDADASVKGTPIAKIDDAPLYVTLLDEKGKVLASKALTEEGTYSFDGKDGVAPEAKYSLVLSTKPSSNASVFPENWSSSGEGLGVADADKDGKTSISVSIKDVTDINFGLNKKPEAEAVMADSQLNPGADIQVQVPSLKGSDAESNATLVYTIIALPKYATLYYDGKKIDKAPFVLSDSTKLTVDPDDGEPSVTFSYTTTDAQNVASDPQQVTMSFGQLEISGHIFNDGNSDDVLNGPAISKADEKQIYILLLDREKTLLSAKAVAEDGTYIFTGKDGIKPHSEYILVLATAPRKDAFGLPEGWSSTGEKINSLSVVKVEQNDVKDVDFGINKKPEADNIELKMQLNPGRDTRVAVPTLSGRDRESDANLSYRIASLPTLGTLYYEDQKIDKNDFLIADQNKLTLDPDDGDKVVLFSYETIDEAGVVSDPARVVMPFKGLTIAGSVVDDGDGNNSGKVKHLKIPKNLHPYATLLDNNNTILASNPIKRDGSFFFNGEDGVYPNTSFGIVVSLEANATSAVLPKGWYESKKASEVLQKDSNDTNASVGNRPKGKITVRILEEDLKAVNIGLNKEPTAENETAKSQINPGRDIRVKVPTLSGHDKESGTDIKYMITKIPDNAKLYNEDKLVSAHDFVLPDALSLDPKDGTQNVTFSYVTIDHNMIQSSPADVNMTFTGLSISGRVLEDFMLDGNVDSVMGISDDKFKLFVTLLNEKEEILSSVEVEKDGHYTLGAERGVNAHTKYRLVLSKEANSTSSVLPNGWNHADGENVNSLGQGNDGKADGIIDVEVKDTDLKKVDFGVNYFIQ